MIDPVRVTRYVTPLREGGSLPGIVEGDDLGTYALCSGVADARRLPVCLGPARASCSPPSSPSC